MRLKSFWLALAGALTIGAFFPAAAQTPLFADNSEIAITIEGPINRLVRDSRRSTDPHPATLTLTSGEAAPRTFPIQIAARGFSRRTLNICAFPPIRLIFQDGTVRGTLFQGQGRVKLVTHCQSSNAYEQQVRVEYLAYRLYNAITPMSFRVRPVQVTYREAGGERSDTHFGFLIEDTDDLARRNGRVELEVQTEQIGYSQLDEQASARLAMFQYMIGNLDWDYVHGPAGEDCCHNGKLIGNCGSELNVIPVPYDFDYSGFVDAPYAVPPEGVSVQNVRVRYYRGVCRHREQVPAAIAEIRSHQAEIMALIAQQEGLTEARRRKATRYIEGFFTLANNPDELARDLTRRCD